MSIPLLVQKALPSPQPQATMVQAPPLQPLDSSAGKLVGASAGGSAALVIADSGPASKQQRLEENPPSKLISSSSI